MTQVKWRQLVIISLIASVFAVWNPLGFDLRQNLLMSSLIVTVACWATDTVHKSLACLFLLGSFMLFGQTPAEAIFGFLWGDMNLLIISTTWLSVAMMKTGLIQKHVETLFNRLGSTPRWLLVLPYLISLPLTVLIPQAFVRVIILGTILDSLLVAKTPQQVATKAVLIFNAFISVTVVYMFFSNGDIVLSSSLQALVGEVMTTQLSFIPWLLYMGLPTLVTGGILLLLIRFLFKAELSHFTPEMLEKSEGQTKASSQHQLFSLWVMLGVLGLWASSGWHGLPAWLVAFAGVGVLFGLRVLEPSDLSSVNPHFILFLMTIFSIGRVLGQTGVTGKIFEHLQTFIPASQSPFYLLVIIAVVMGLHMAIGSVIATMSVIFPILLPLMQEADYSVPVIVLMVFVLTNLHFLMPFHHATILIGSGKKYYPDRFLLRYGLVMTVLVPILLLTIYLNWWRLIG